ncbi:sensor histidine kinase [Cohnella lupini]|uniref:Two-component system sensor histidine kinase YesM n=1 Tax=Cohnella lupini TaxID=1294267 RepID=A0A3D9I3B1_9BACL|nr:histidine kinase [Cohnella lupini]RED56258.1 two-component system sensor histidine kinase YesM [Cohnella lupini]
MNDTGVFWKHSIFTRLIVTFLVSMVPIFVLGIWMYKWSSQQMSEEIFKSMKLQVEYYMDSLDHDIQRIQKLQFDMTQDEDLNQIANASQYLDNFEKTKAILRIHQRLSSIKNSSGYIQDARVLIPSLNWSINADGHSRGVYSDILGDEFDELRVLKSDSASQLVQWKDRLLLLAGFPNYAQGGKPPLFIIEIELSKTALKSALLQLDGYKDSGFMMRQPSQRFVLENVNDEVLRDRLVERLNVAAQESRNGSIKLELHGQPYLIVYTKSDYTGITLSYFLPQEGILKSLKSLVTWNWIFLFIAIMITAVYSFSLYRLIKRPLVKLIGSFRMVESGNLQIRIDYAHRDEFGYLYRRYNAMVEKLQNLIEQVYEQKILSQKAELKQLQTQINPHFLYNSYFLLHRIIKKEDYANALRFSKEIGRYFQFVTRNAADTVTLDKEVEHARIYAEIQAMRFAGRIAVEFADFPGGLAHLEVPRLILQPIIENAFEHGLENKQENGLLAVRFEPIAGGIVVTVEDNGEELSESDLDNLLPSIQRDNDYSEVTGLSNIHRRVRLFCGEGSGLAVSRAEIGGLKVRLTIIAAEAGASEHV